MVHVAGARKDQGKIVQKRELKRLVGFFKVRLPELKLRTVSDPRRQASVRHRLHRVLGWCLVGMCAGAKSFAQLEAFTENVTLAVARALGLRGRLPDTTARNVIERLDVRELRALLHRAIRAAHRRKAITHDGIPPGIVSMDGKATAINAWDDTIAQKQDHSAGPGAHGVIRTITASLISSPARPIIDAFPVPASTNEAGAFPDALDALLNAYASIGLVRMVLYDSGACTRANADYASEKGVLWAFALTANQPTLLAEAKRILGDKPLESANHVSRDKRGNATARRHLFITEELAGFHDWRHLRTTLRIVSDLLHPDGTVEHVDERYFISSAPAGRFTADKWNLIIRRRWAVENEAHNVLDTAFEEDTKPYFKVSPPGALNVMILRRIAHTLLSFLRAVTFRSKANRAIPWKSLFAKMAVALVAATAVDVDGLRQRPGDTASV